MQSDMRRLKLSAFQHEPCTSVKAIPLRSVLTVKRRMRISTVPRAEGDQNDIREKLHRLIKQDPDINESMQKLKEAAAMVAEAQAQRQAFDDEARAAKNASPSDLREQEQRQAQRAAGRGASEDVLRAADKLEEAKAAYAEALADKSKWATALDEESERIESAKAGAVAAVGSTVASLPFAATMTGSLVEAALALGVAFVTGLLFGVTYRYAVRQDENPQLKGGVVAAFGLARGLTAAENALKSSEGNEEAILSVKLLGNAALLCGESILAIAFAAVAVEAAFRSGFVRQLGPSSSGRA